MARVLAIISYRVFPAHMGGQKGVVKFYDYLQHYHSVQLAVSANNEDHSTEYAVKKILYPNGKIFFNFFRIFHLIKLIRQYQIDLLIAEHSYTGWLTLLLKRFTKKPFIIHAHNIEASRFRQMHKKGWQFYGLYEKWIHQKADFSFFVTEEDKSWALQQYKLHPMRCSVIPYGVDNIRRIPAAAATLRSQLNSSSTYLFYFNGTLNYRPNEEAVINLLEHINPILQKSGLDYTILLSGKWLRRSLQQQVKATGNMCYLGFVEDPSLLYQGCTLFLNPVINDSGIKTKVVEALANHCNVVSFAMGASGVPQQYCAGKLKIAEDRNWNHFVGEVLHSLQEPFQETPPAFFTYFSWKNIASKAANKINQLLAYA